MYDEKKLNIIGWAIKLIFTVPALIFSFAVMTSGVTADSDALEFDALMNSTSFSGAINLTVISVIIAIALILIFFGALLVVRPKDAIRSILGILVSLVLFFILYLIGTDDTLESLRVIGDITAGESTLNFVHAGIWTALILVVICSILAVLMSFLMKLLRK